MAYLDPNNPSADTQIGDDSQPDWFATNAPPASGGSNAFTPVPGKTGGVQFGGPGTIAGLQQGDTSDLALFSTELAMFPNDPQKAIDAFDQMRPGSTLQPKWYADRRVIGVQGQSLPYLTAPGTSSGQTQWSFGGVAGGDAGNGTSPPATPRDALGQLPVPSLNLPGFKQAPAFTPTSMGDVLADPGYQFRTQQGQAQLQQSAAARGVLNSGGTLKDILDYGQNAASQEFQNVDARRRSDYQTNYQTQYTDPYTYAYQAAKDAFSLPNDESLRAFSTIWDPALRISGAY